MKFGIHDRRNYIAAGAWLSLALLLTGHWMYGTLSCMPVVSDDGAIHGRELSAKWTVKNANDSDPTLHDAWLKATENQRYESSGRNVFLAYAEAQPKRIRRVPEPQGSSPPDRRTTPAIRLKMFGFATRASSPKIVFLSKNADLFIASQGEIVDGRYKIVRIGASSVEVEDLLENHLYTLRVQPGS